MRVRERGKDGKREMQKNQMDCNAITGLAITLFVTNKVNKL